MTLIEITIVLLLIGVLTMIAIPAISNVTGADLRATARRISASLRFTYDLAARKSAVFRLVCDLDQRSYWVESASEKFLLDRKKIDVVDGALDDTADENKHSRFVSRSFIESGDMWEPKTKATFSNFAGSLTKKKQLPEDIAIADVWVAHQTEAVTQGLAYVYAFPSGMTQRAVIHLMDNDKNYFTLWVYPLTGRVKITPGYIEAPDE
jgi:Tfp pilus assembly protein FimT